MVERGDRRNMEIQPISYSKLRWKNITPTDIDGFLDFQNKVFVYIEYKYKDTKLDGGQELAFRRAVDNCRKPCCLIHATHNHPMEEVIDGANAKVVRIYFRGRWRPDSGIRTVKEVIDAFLAFNGII